MGPAPWRPCFSTDQDNLNNLDRGSHKEHLFQIIFKLDRRFLRRRFSKFALKLAHFSPLWPLCAMDRNRLNNFERGSPNEHSCEVSSNLSLWFRRRCRLKKKFTPDVRTPRRTDGRTPDRDISTTGTMCPLVLKRKL